MPTKDTTIAFHFGLPGCTLLETIARHGFQDEKSIVRHGCQSEINSHHDVRHGFPGCTLLETIVRHGLPECFHFLHSSAYNYVRHGLPG